MASRFLRWWSEQLQACGHELLGFLLPKRRQHLTVYWDAARLLFVEESPSESLTDISCADDGYLPGELPPALAPVREQNNRVRLVISPARAYIRQWQLPLAAVPHVETAIALQLPRLLPLAASELLTDFEIIANESSPKMASIDIAVLKRTEVSRILNSLKSWGLRVASVHLGQASEPSHRFEFKAAGVFGHRQTLRRPDRVLLAAAAVLGLACATLAATEVYRGQAALQRAQNATRVPADAALAHRQELLARLEPLRALAHLESVPSATVLLTEVTVLVPQSTWLTAIEIKDQTMRIVGVSPNSGNVVKLISSSPLLNEVALRSSMSLGIGIGLDRFEITARLKEKEP